MSLSPGERGRIEDRARAALRRVDDPCSIASSTPMSLEEMGLIETLSVDPQGRVTLRLRLTTPVCLMVGVIARQVRDRLAEIGIAEVEVTTDSRMSWRPEHIQPAAATRRRATLASRLGQPTTEVRK